MSEKTAPGLVWRKRADGRQAYWIASRQAVATGFQPKTVRLDPAYSEDEIIAACVRLQGEVAEWLAGDNNQRVKFDGSFGSLIELFQVHDISRFKRVKWNTRQTYTYQLKILKACMGGRQINKLGGVDFDRTYWEFRKPAVEGGREQIVRANRLMTMIRMVIGFGVVLGIKKCTDLKGILSEMRFENGAPRQQILTAAMVVALRKAAHAAGRPSIALAMAIQFETALRQKDVIGEWAPGPDMQGNFGRDGQRWQSGLVWGQHIDGDLVLRKPTSKSRFRKRAEMDLKRCPMVLEELEHVDTSNRIGPVIISEVTRQPYLTPTFYQLWRRLARKAGIPDDIWNMDARAGAISEASVSGSDATELRALATHSGYNMTPRYDRATLDKTDAVMDRRTKGRNKP